MMDVIENSFVKLSSKYGKGGYAKMYFKDQKYQDFINGMQELTADKNKFIDVELKIIKKLRLADENLTNQK